MTNAIWYPGLILITDTKSKDSQINNTTKNTKFGYNLYIIITISSAEKREEEET